MEDKNGIKPIWISKVFLGLNEIISVEEILQERKITIKEVQEEIQKFRENRLEKNDNFWNDFTQMDNDIRKDVILDFQNRAKFLKGRLEEELKNSEEPRRKRFRGTNRMVEVGRKVGWGRELWVRPAALGTFLEGFRRRLGQVVQKTRKISKSKNKIENVRCQWGEWLEAANPPNSRMTLEAEDLGSQIRAEVRFACEVRDFMEGDAKRDGSLSQMYHLFKKRGGQKLVTLRRFRKALALLTFRYNTSCRTFPTTPKQREATFMALNNVFLNLIKNEQTVYFFDTTTFCFEAHPRRSWQTSDCRTFFRASSNFTRYHLLMILGRGGVCAWQVFIGKITTAVISSFLFFACRHFRESQPQLTPWLLLDNAKMHKTELMKLLAGAGVASLTFTGPHSPFINPIEEAFRFIKAPLRNRHFFDE